MASETASPRLSFPGGDLHGKFHVSGVFSTTRYHGLLHITGGTRQLKHVSGTLELHCRVTAPIVTCQASGPLSGI